MTTPAEDTNIESSKIIDEVSSKIKDANNILVALSSDPSVDELAAAIGLSIAIDGMGKHATAIYSGTTPNAIEFLNPEKAFESNPDSLQDFIIAIDKEKADHLRYKLDGEFVKIYITPYHSKISQEDLEFSYGDFNVDLVIALNVSNGIDLDSALREHGRIMHDASVINITTGRPGKLGEIEWSDPSSSSVSEMAAELVYGMDTVSKEEATAFLTGIVAATDRFANARTTSHSFEIASRLMTSGADQQLVAEHITPELGDHIFDDSSSSHHDDTQPDNSSDSVGKPSSEDKTKLDIHHDEVSEEKPEPASEQQPSSETERPEPEPAPTPKIPKLDSPTPPVNSAQQTTPPVKPVNTIKFNKPKIESDPLLRESTETGPRGSVILPNDLDKAKEDKTGIPKPGVISYDRQEAKIVPTPVDFTRTNPAAASAPQVPKSPEVNHIPDINYMPMPGDEILPPPPTPPVDFSSPLPNPPTSSSLPPVPPIPSRPNGSGSPASSDNSPNSFQIPNL